MLYYLIRPLTRIALKAYFRRITINGLENLPKDKPVLLCSNHPTAFIEPCLMACFFPRTLHFLVRGDLFERPILGKILIATNQLPIWRMRDGYEKLRNNRALLNMSYDKLAEGNAILVFPEASTTEVKYLRPITKGAARMAIETLKLHPGIDLSIVPIGVNYSKPNRWRSYVTINIGDPIIPVLPDDEHKLPREIRQLSTTIEEEVGKLLLVRNEGVSNEDLDTLVDIGQWGSPVQTSLVRRVGEHEQFNYERALSSTLRDSLPVGKLDKVGPDLHKFTRKGISFFEGMLAVLIVIPVAIALLMNVLPFIIAVLIRNQYVREKEFSASVEIAASLGSYIVLFFLVFIVLFIFYSWWALLLFLLPLVGLVGLYGYDFIVNVWHRLKLIRKFSQEEREEIFKTGMAMIKGK